MSRTFIATNSFSRKRVCFSGPFRDCLTTNLLLYNPRKLRVFNFLCSRCDLFFKSFQLPSLKFLEPLSTQITILFKPLHFQTRYLQNLFKVCASNTLFTFPFKIMQKFSSGSWKLGIFWKWVEVLCFREYFFKNFDWAVSHLLFVHLCWPIVAVWACIQAFFTVFLHCS